MNKKMMAKVDKHLKSKAVEEKKLCLEKAQKEKVDEYVHDLFVKRYAKKFFLSSLIVVPLSVYFVLSTSFMDGFTRFLTITLLPTILIIVKMFLLIRIKIEEGIER